MAMVDISNDPLFVPAGPGLDAPAPNAGASSTDKGLQAGAPNAAQFVGDGSGEGTAGTSPSAVPDTHFIPKPIKPIEDPARTAMARVSDMQPVLEDEPQVTTSHYAEGSSSATSPSILPFTPPSSAPTHPISLPITSRPDLPFAPQADLDPIADADIPSVEAEGGVTGMGREVPASAAAPATPTGRVQEIEDSKQSTGIGEHSKTSDSSQRQTKTDREDLQNDLDTTSPPDIPKVSTGAGIDSIDQASLDFEKHWRNSNGTNTLSRQGQGQGQGEQSDELTVPPNRSGRAGTAASTWTGPDGKVRTSRVEVSGTAVDATMTGKTGTVATTAASTSLTTRKAINESTESGATSPANDLIAEESEFEVASGSLTTTTTSTHTPIPPPGSTSSNRGTFVLDPSSPYTVITGSTTLTGAAAISAIAPGASPYTPTSSLKQQEEGGMSGGMITGIVIGGVVLLCIAGLVWYKVRGRKSDAEGNDAEKSPTHTDSSTRSAKFDASARGANRQSQASRWTDSGFDFNDDPVSATSTVIRHRRETIAAHHRQSLHPYLDIDADPFDDREDPTMAQRLEREVQGMETIHEEHDCNYHQAYRPGPTSSGGGGLAAVSQAYQDSLMKPHDRQHTWQTENPFHDAAHQSETPSSRRLTPPAFGSAKGHSLSDRLRSQGESPTPTEARATSGWSRPEDVYQANDIVSPFDDQHVASNTATDTTVPYAMTAETALPTKTPATSSLLPWINEDIVPDVPAVPVSAVKTVSEPRTRKAKKGTRSKTQAGSRSAAYNTAEAVSTHGAHGSEDVYGGYEELPVQHPGQDHGWSHVAPQFSYTAHRGNHPPHHIAAQQALRNEPQDQLYPANGSRTVRPPVRPMMAAVPTAARTAMIQKGWGDVPIPNFR